MLLPRRDFFLLRIMDNGYKVMASLVILVLLVILDLVVIFGETGHTFKIDIFIRCKLGIFTLTKLVTELGLLVNQMVLSLGLLVAHLVFMVHMLDMICRVMWGMIWASAVLSVLGLLLWYTGRVMQASFLGIIVGSTLGRMHVNLLGLLVDRIMGRIVGRSMLSENLDSIHLGLMLIMLILKALCKIMLLKLRDRLNHEHMYLILIPHTMLGYLESLIFMHLIFRMPHSMIPTLIILIHVFLC
ncbi:hypothetical protein ES332_D05G226000v1 [Gossypium tomentosum]|uniref:Uncharacterized protein n=1 Tax=Gossypium tomentosum TaxID=34277 RepID=A0A5D2KZ07_GOSTO|nr:hypothetical protein ES332_D05G226000v1 [Gossypium tomentosum]